jgi:hypothetical protein
MKIRHPVYIPFALAVVVFVAAANHNGWSLIHSVALRAWPRSTSATQHK